MRGRVLRWLLIVALAGGVTALVAVSGDVRAEMELALVRWGVQGLLTDVRERLGGTNAPEGLVASGFIEATSVALAPEVGGRVTAVNASEGDQVRRGQVLVELDSALLDAQVRLAEADVAVAQAALDQVKAGVRQETLAHARAVLAQAEAAEALARVAWQDAQAMLAEPQDLELAISAVRGQLGVLDFRAEQAQALAASAQAALDLANETLRVMNTFQPRDDWVLVGKWSPDALPPEIPPPPDLVDGEWVIGDFKLSVHNGVVTVQKLVRVEIPVDVLQAARQQQGEATYGAWTAWTAVAEAEAARNGLQNQLSALLEQRSKPLTFLAEAHQAESQLQIAGAAVEVARAQVVGLELGATPAQVAAAEARVEAAQAALAAKQAEAARLVLRAALDGIVLEQSIRVGELAVPGVPLLTLADLAELRLTVYVPQDHLGSVQVGQPVTVTVDAFPGRSFMGNVRSIGSQAEFTPADVQTREERLGMVFAVQIVLPNPDRALKPGMPARAAFPAGK